ncbi:hypothetical protein BC749_103384 [Flavobacterium araucananum]|nr:hypothetical protein BC749_103384 [Flavobacterium araucananum]
MSETVNERKRSKIVQTIVKWITKKDIYQK